jgi:replicative DNA helicase
MPYTPTDPNDTTIETAIYLAQLGLRVVPIKPGHKHPPMPAWQDAATSDESIIRKWYEGQYRGFGLGVATGHMGNGQHLFVLDIDEHDPATSGSDTLHDLEATNGKLPDTVEVATGSGGRHLYFLSDVEIRNDAGKKLGPGLDIRGEGGQVLAPPTTHPNGKAYLWVFDSEPWTLDIANAPQWLINKLVDTKQGGIITESHTRDEFLTGDSIADTYNASTTWQQLLEADKWQHSYTDTHGEHHWTRPGKTTREGTSATTNYQNRDILKVFTSSIPWLPEGAYSKFQYFSLRHHNGDMSKAAKSLKQSHTVTHVAAKPNDEWPELIPLFDETKRMPFPIEVFPKWLSDHVLALSEDLQTPVDLPANLGLGVLAVAVLGRAKVFYPRGNWTQSLNIYMAVTLPPSIGKSPAKAAMFSVLEEIEQKRIRVAAVDLADFETTKRLKEKSQRASEEKAVKSKGSEREVAEDEARVLSAEIALMQKPLSGKLLVDDITIEALGVELADAGGCLAIVTAEGGIFDRIAGLYSDQAANLDLYLDAWSSGRYSVSRIGRPPILINETNLCVVTTVQPVVLDAIGTRREFRGRGLTERFLLTLPETNVGRRDRKRISTSSPDIRKAYEQAVIDLTDMYFTRRVTLVVDDSASELYSDWDQWTEDSLAPGQFLEHMGEFVGKLRASVLRIAALLHLANGDVREELGVEVMKNAITLGNYYLNHAQAISNRWGTDGSLLKAQQIIEWAKSTKRSEFTVRDLQRSNGRRYKSTEDTRAPLELLMERGWIRPLFSGPIHFGTRGGPSLKFELRPEQ